jgi:hypothetical protein
MPQLLLHVAVGQLLTPYVTAAVGVCLSNAHDQAASVNQPPAAALPYSGH